MHFNWKIQCIIIIIRSSQNMFKIFLLINFYTHFFQSKICLKILFFFSFLITNVRNFENFVIVTLKESVLLSGRGSNFMVIIPNIYIYYINRLRSELSIMIITINY